mmetsp:Transcript_20153/g.20252  ORF Transcript_20153/g.20252 Transcript_20153/m.20252 type:complete len:558 (+) Transcript_20153:129-1802(+)|eukprot:CAMPEP_0182417008 /NCGR_PEP_ID=MMETSP1167-20130531/1445_1 /TAXON_ID=2988 /ORGANISM="Mallomonas Sp, Strain CCMP3275" /LENGTH=557 /DNA_ID=CAMNT_0024590267 /DNA_START=106 /DNA_END=1779 /DNA_ORIENTATION=+
MSAIEFKNQGNQFLQSGEYDKAIEAYTQAISLNSTDHVFYSNRSAAYLSKGDGLNALNDAEKCIALSAQWPKGYTRKGAALHSLKRYDEAVAAYEAGISIAPADTGLKSGLDEVRKAKESADSNRGKSGGFNLKNQLIAKLATHPKFGAKLADPTFMAKLGMMETNPDLMLKDPEMMEAFSVLLGGGEGMFGQNFDGKDDSPMDTTPPAYTPPPKPAQPQRVETEEEKASRSVKERALAAKDRGNALYKQKQFDEALAAYDEAISIDPSNILFINNKASVYIEMGDTETAMKLCKEAIEVGRSNKSSYSDIAKVYQRMASAALKKDDIPAAMEFYGKAQMEEFDKNIERKMKNLELDLKKKKAQAYINPEEGLAAKERGNTAFREGKFADAIKEYEEAVKRDPKNAAYHNNLAAALLKVGNFNGAKAEVEKAIDIDQNYMKAWAKKGDIEFFMKEYHKALESYRKGLMLEPDNTLCKQGMQKTMAKINEASGGEMDKERQAHAMADPEIQSILQDPMVRQVLTDLQENPKYGQQAMNDPVMRGKIEKLIASGVLQVK